MKIIPFGSDCHPAMILKKHKLREQSFPFDWCTSNILENIIILENNFDGLLELEKINGKYYSKTYKNFCFFHFNDENYIKEKFTKRIKELNNIIRENQVLFLICYNVNINFNKEHFLNLLDKINNSNLLKKHYIYIYIRYESYNLKKELIQFIKKINIYDNIFINIFLRQKIKNGHWGSKKNIKFLINDIISKINK